MEGVRQGRGAATTAMNSARPSPLLLFLRRPRIALCRSSLRGPHQRRKMDMREATMVWTMRLTTRNARVKSAEEGDSQASGNVRPRRKSRALDLLAWENFGDMVCALDRQWTALSSRYERAGGRRMRRRCPVIIPPSLPLAPLLSRSFLPGAMKPVRIRGNA